MEYSVLAAVIVGLILKHLVAPKWEGFSTKLIPVIIFAGSFVQQLMAELGLPPLEAAQAAVQTTLLATGVHSTSKNVLAQWLLGKKRK
jgi:hypothetical protein